MLFQQEKLREINSQIEDILLKISNYEARYSQQIKNVHPNYRKSAKNLIHYLAFRTFDNDILQDKLYDLGLPTSTISESSILSNIITYKTIINSLLHIEDDLRSDSSLSNSESINLQKVNTDALFGRIKNNRVTRIMVTQPTLAAEDKSFAKNLTKLGMDCARVNCSHDDEDVWKKIIYHTKKANLGCKIMMDLGGPKLRTGKMKPGHKVIHLKPKRNTLGQVLSPSKIWLAPFGVTPPNNEEADAIIPVNKKWLNKTHKGSYIVFKDARNKKCKIVIDKKEDVGRWASCTDSAFVTTGAKLNVFIEDKSTSEIHSVHEMLPLEEVIFLYEGDLLRLDREQILGEPKKYNDEGELIEMAHISCTLPQLFSNVKVGEPIYFDDGKIEGFIKENNTDHLLIEITNTKKKGGKLKADKGINLPESNLQINGLTEKDKTDLKFIANHADAVNFSFVNSKHDVEDLLNEFKKLEASLGIIIKVETKDAFKNLPSIILKGMENYPIGIMIARGDLAIETGWKNFAIIQKEIMRTCEAAHLPDIWATQVLENLAKKGVPTRSEITDASAAQRAECVMLNKGLYIDRAVKMLDKILCKMQKTKKKKKRLTPKLRFNDIE